MITKFRASNNKFPITGGRYNNISREDCVCEKCNANVLCDEYRVMLTCENEDIVRFRINIFLGITEKDQVNINMYC